jgi:DNA repair photolyase
MNSSPQSQPPATTDSKKRSPAKILGEPVDFWKSPAVISPNNFKYKSLSNWAFNISVGCRHACRFCYVPSTATNKQAPELKKYQVKDPDEQWGEYSLLRPWDEKAFLASLKRAEAIPKSKLKPDGNRAVMFCTTTDPYQVFKASTDKKGKLLNESAKALVRKALEAIRDQSSLNVRILTRSPLAKLDFDLFKSFGNRLVFGMSLPTLRNDLSKIYEPNAPAPSQRLKTLQAAKAAGLHVYVAMAPTYPECNEADLRATLTAIKELDPITIFHEPINIRAENVARIEQHAKKIGVMVNTADLSPKDAWRQYAVKSLQMVQRLATEMKVIDHLHLWPDRNLGTKSCFLEILKKKRAEKHLTKYQEKCFRQDDQKTYAEKYLPWLEGWWHRISEWPR